MGKKYLDLIRISYPMSNLAYVVSVNNKVLEDGGQPPNNSVELANLEPETIVVLEKAGLFNAANRNITEVK